MATTTDGHHHAVSSNSLTLCSSKIDILAACKISRPQVITVLMNLNVFTALNTGVLCTECHGILLCGSITATDNMYILHGLSLSSVLWMSVLSTALKTHGMCGYVHCTEYRWHFTE